MPAGDPFPSATHSRARKQRGIGAARAAVGDLDIVIPAAFGLEAS
jgi:hypothetical protein